MSGPHRTNWASKQASGMPGPPPSCSTPGFEVAPHRVLKYETQAFSSSYLMCNTGDQRADRDGRHPGIIKDYSESWLASHPSQCPPCALLSPTPLWPPPLSLCVSSVHLLLPSFHLSIPLLHPLSPRAQWSRLPRLPLCLPNERVSSSPSHLPSLFLPVSPHCACL